MVQGTGNVLQGLQDRFRKLQFQIQESDGLTYVNSFDRSFGFIDDTLIIINDLCHDQETTLAERDSLVEMKQQLMLLNDVLEKLGKCQSQVMYLFWLFTSGEPKCTLDKWNTLLDDLKVTGYRVYDLASHEWLERLTELGHEFDALCLGLVDLAESFQHRCNRLSYLGNNEVLKIIQDSRGGDVECLQAFMRRLFQFQGLDMDGAMIVGLRSDIGEVLPLLKAVNTYHKGFDLWMLELVTQMKISVTHHTMMLVSEYGTIGFRTWAMMAPSQCVLLALRIVHTRDVEFIFKRFGTLKDRLHDELQALRDDLQEKIADVRVWIEAGNKQARAHCLMALLIRLREVTDEVISDSVASKQHPTWQRHIRFYCETGVSVDEAAQNETSHQVRGSGSAPRRRHYSSAALSNISMTAPFPAGTPVPRPPTAPLHDIVPLSHTTLIVMRVHHIQFQHGGEYWPPQKAVITPQGATMEQTYCSILHTLHSQHVGCMLQAPPPDPSALTVAPHPPWEILSSLAEVVGKKMQIVDCRNNLPHATIARFTNSAFSSGIWLCYKHIDKLDPTLLSVIHEGSVAIQDAMRNKANHYQFEGKVVPIVNRTFAVFGTLSGEPIPDTTRYALRRLQQVLPMVSAPAVPMSHILSTAIQLHGVDEADSEKFATHLTTFMRRVAVHHMLSPHLPVTRKFLEHFCAVLAEVNEAAPLRQKGTVSLINAIYKSTLHQLPPDLWSIIGNLTKVIFSVPGSPVPPLDDQVELSPGILDSIDQRMAAHRLVTKQTFVAKCMQLHDILLTSRGVIVTGPVASGKSSALRVVIEALPDSGVTALFPTLFPDTSLLGCLDTHDEWTDGPFTHVFRQLTSDTTGIQVIVLDGLPSPGVLEALIPVLTRGIHCLTLPSGEVIRCAANFRLVFEIESLEGVPEALLEVCQVVKTDGMLSHTEYIWNFSLDPDFYLYPYRNQVAVVLEKLVPDLIGWAADHKLIRDWNNDKDTNSPRADHPVLPIPINTFNLTRSCFNVINGFRNKKKTTRWSANDDKGLVEAVVEPLILFGCVWSYGIAIAPTRALQVQFNQFFRNLIIDKGLKARFPMPMGDELGLVFDYLYDVDRREWIRWSEATDMMGEFMVTATGEENRPPDPDEFIANLGLVRYTWILNHLADKGNNLLVCGEPATAKSRLLCKSLRHYTVIQCANTTPKDMETTVGTRLQKSRAGVICLPDKMEKPLTLVLEGLEMVQEPCLDFVRQLRDNNGWYDPYTNELLKVYDVAVAATVSTDGILKFSERQLAPFHTITIEHQEDDDIEYILKRKLDQWFCKSSNPSFLNMVSPSSGLLARTLVQIYKHVSETLHPTLDPKYRWTVAPVYTILKNMTRMPLSKITMFKDLARLFINECIFVFASVAQPRSEARQWVVQLVWDRVLANFPHLTYATIMQGKPFLCYYGAAEYKEYRLPEVWVATLQRALWESKDDIFVPLEYKPGSDELPVSVANVSTLLKALSMNILLFTKCLELHLDELKLAAHAFNGNLVAPKLSVHHSKEEWKSALREVCLLAVVSTKSTIVVFEESSLPQECLPDICSLVKTGELVGLFGANDWNNLGYAVKDILSPKDGGLSRGHIKNIVRERLLKCLHFVIARDTQSSSFAQDYAEHVTLQSHFYPIHLDEEDPKWLADHGRHVLECLPKTASSLTPDEVERVCRAGVRVYLEVLRAGEEVAVSEADSQSFMWTNLDRSANAFIQLMRIVPRCMSYRSERQERHDRLDHQCKAIGSVVAGMPARVREQWERIKHDWDEGTGHAAIGDAMMLGAWLVWIAVFPFREKVALFRSIAAILRDEGCPPSGIVDEHGDMDAMQLDVVVNHLLCQSGSPIDVKSRILRHLHAALAILPADKPLVILDPLCTAVQALQSLDNDLLFRTAPFPVTTLNTLADGLQMGRITVLNDVTEADLATTWLTATVSSLRWKVPNNPNFVKIGDRVLELTSTFRLAFILKPQSDVHTIPAHLRTALQAVPLGVCREELEGYLTLYTIGKVVQDLDFLRQRRLHEQELVKAAEAALLSVPSGRGATAAKWEADLPGLIDSLTNTKEGLEQVTNDLDRVEKEVTSEVVEHMSSVGRQAAMYLCASIKIARLHPCSQFSVDFFTAELDKAVRDINPSSPLTVSQHAALIGNKFSQGVARRLMTSAITPYDIIQHILLLSSYSSSDARLAADAIFEGCFDDGFRDKVLSHLDLIKDILGDDDESEDLTLVDRVFYTKMMLGREFAADLPDPSAALTARFQPVTELHRAINSGGRVPTLVATHSEAHFPATVDSLLPKGDGTREKVQSGRKMYVITAAHSQRLMARSFIEDAVHEGGLITIINLMASAEFTMELCAVVDAVKAAPSVHPDYGLVIHTAPSQSVPSSFVRRCRVLGVAAQKGLGNELRCCVAQLRGYFLSPSSTSRINHPTKLAQLSMYLPCIVLFHALVMERQAAGWLATEPLLQYQPRDLTEGVVQLVELLTVTPPDGVSSGQVRFLLADLVYGSRLQKESDRDMLWGLAHATIHDGCRSQQYSFASSPRATVGRVQYDFLRYVDKLTTLPTTPAEWIHLHPFMIQRHATSQFKSMLRQIQSTSSPQQLFAFHHLGDLDRACTSLLHDLPPEFEVAKAFDWLPKPSTLVRQTTYPLMQHELGLYNSVLARIKRDIFRMQRALKREIPFTDTLRETAVDLIENRTPAEWISACCDIPSPIERPTLAAWFRHTLEGHRYFHQWSNEGHNPAALDLSYFLNPGFVVSTAMDTYCMTKNISASTIKVFLHVLDNVDVRRIDFACGYYVSGLSLWGGEWDASQQMVVKDPTGSPSRIALAQVIGTVAGSGGTEDAAGGLDADGGKIGSLPRGTATIPLYRTSSQQQLLAELEVIADPSFPPSELRDIFFTTLPW